MTPIEPDVATLSVTIEGSVVWNAERTRDEQLPQRLQVSAPRQPLRENYVRGDRLLEFRVVQVLSAAPIASSSTSKGLRAVPIGDPGAPVQQSPITSPVDSAHLVPFPTRLLGPVFAPVIAFVLLLDPTNLHGIFPMVHGPWRIILLGAVWLFFLALIVALAWEEPKEDDGAKVARLERVAPRRPPERKPTEPSISASSQSSADQGSGRHQLPSG